MPRSQRLRKLPYAPALTPAEWLGAAAGALAPKWPAVADRNLTIAFPEMDRQARTRIRHAMFRSLGRILLTIARAETLKRETCPAGSSSKTCITLRMPKNEGKVCSF